MTESEFEGRTENAIDAEEASLRRRGLLGTVFALPTWLAALALFLLMGMTFLDVLFRSALNAPFQYGTELTRLLMAIIVFASLPMVSWKGRHIVVDLMDPLFSRRLARVRDTVIDLSAGIMLFWPAKRVWDLAERARDFGDVTEYMGLPQYVPGWFIAFFTFATAVVLVIRGLARIFAPDWVGGK